MNARVELHKGSTFAVGRLQLKVQNIEGACADNKALLAKMEAESSGKPKTVEKEEVHAPACHLPA